MVYLDKTEDQPCEGCGAEAGEPCNPHMGCREQAAGSQYGRHDIPLSAYEIQGR